MCLLWLEPSPAACFTLLTRQSYPFLTARNFPQRPCCARFFVAIDDTQGAVLHRQVQPMPDPLGESHQKAEAIRDKRKSSYGKRRYYKRKQKPYPWPRHFPARDTSRTGESSFEQPILHGRSDDAILALRCRRDA